MTDQAPQAAPEQSNDEKRENLLQSVNNLYNGAGRAPLTRQEHQSCDASALQLQAVIHDMFPPDKTTAAPEAPEAEQAEVSEVERTPEG